jgi:protein ImuB
MLVDPELGRVDARGWERLGGEKVLGRVLLEALREAGMRGIGIGIGDVAVVADAAARLADPGPIIVPPEKGREFLASLPLGYLPISEELQEAFRALGWRKIDQLAERDPNELEARFGPAGLEAHLWARGEDRRAFHAIPPPESQEVSLELEYPATALEPLLFALRHLLARMCAGLSDGLCAAELRLRLKLDGGKSQEATVLPARPTRRESLLFDLCRAALERSDGGSMTAPVSGLALELRATAPAEARQGDLFHRGWRVGGGWDDPLGAAIALARLQARLGEEVVVTPAVRANHRPESRSVWMPVTPKVLASSSASGDSAGRVSSKIAPYPDGSSFPQSWASRDADRVSSALRLLREPIAVRVRTEGNRPIELQDEGGRHELVAAEGPERLSGDWWKDPYRREYFRVCTSGGELLWLFREYRPSGELRWWLHGWWD